MKTYKEVYSDLLRTQVPPEEIEYCMKHTKFKKGPAPEYYWLENTYDIDGWSFDIVVGDYTTVYYYKES